MANPYAPHDGEYGSHPTRDSRALFQRGLRVAQVVGSFEKGIGDVKLDPNTQANQFDQQPRPHAPASYGQYPGWDPAGGPDAAEQWYSSQNTPTQGYTMPQSAQSSGQTLPPGNPGHYNPGTQQGSNYYVTPTGPGGLTQSTYHQHGQGYYQPQYLNHQYQSTPAPGHQNPTQYGNPYPSGFPGPGPPNIPQHYSPPPTYPAPHGSSGSSPPPPGSNLKPSHTYPGSSPQTGSGAAKCDYCGGILNNQNKCKKITCKSWWLS